MNEENLVNYYNKFNEDKRLKSRHGIVEYETTMKYIKDFINDTNTKLLDIGAGCGAYSIALSNLGIDVTAFELVKHNLKVIEQNNKDIKCIQGNAINLKKLEDETYDITLLFGPMYHLISKDEKIKALNEAKRVTKKNGIIFVAYCMNEYAFLSHAIKDKNLLSDINNGLLDNNFHVTPKNTDLYSYVRLDDINELNDICNLERIKIISPDGPTDHIRSYINDLSEEEFNIYKEYVLSIAERSDLIGAGSHVVDILKKI